MSGWPASVNRLPRYLATARQQAQGERITTMNDQARFDSPNQDALVAHLRQYADDIEAGRIPAPSGLYAGITYVRGGGDKITADTARRAMALAPGGWDKQYSGNSVVYTKSYGEKYGESVVTSLYVDRDEVCTRVQVGTRHVPAVEAHDEPVYEWHCVDDDDDATNEQAHLAAEIDSDRP